MKTNYLHLLCLFLVAIVSHACNAQTLKENSEKKVMQEIQQSHIDANIPDKNRFDSLLKRDLQKHFSALYGPINIDWKFLRDGPTQSGVSYPKYYLWLKIKNTDEPISEGAVCVQAVDKERFDITNYIDIKQIKDKSLDI
jgi:hypothetical protein